MVVPILVNVKQYMIIVIVILVAVFLVITAVFAIISNVATSRSTSKRHKIKKEKEDIKNGQ